MRQHLKPGDPPSRTSKEAMLPNTWGEMWGQVLQSYIVVMQGLTP